MAQTTEHVVRIRADAKDLKKAGDEIGRTFTPRAIEPMRVKVRELERSLVTLTKTQEKYNQALRGADKGSAAYTKLRKEIKELEREARGTETAITRLNRSIQGADRDAERSARKAQASGLRAFGAGVLQGSGLAQYLPHGQGLGWRAAGAMAGRAVFGAGRAVSAPFLSPGIGGMAQMLSSIPVVGGMAAGALSAGQGYYQQAVALDQARLRNLYMAPPTIGKFHGTATAAEVQAAQDMNARVFQARIGRGPQAMMGMQLRRTMPPAPANRIQAGGAAILQTAGAAGGLSPMAMIGLESLMDRSRGRGASGLMQRLTPQEVSQETHEATIKAETNYLEAIYKDAAKRAKRGYREGTMGDEMTLGVAFGLDAQAVQSAKGSYFGARGGYSRRPEVMGEFRAALAAQTMYGISPEMAGNFARHKREMDGKGPSDRGEGLAHVLAMAVEQGLEGSLAVEYLGTIVDFQKRAAQQGVKFDAAAFTRSSSLMQAMGVTGPQGTRVAAGIQTAAMSLGKTGVSSPMQMLMLRAMGYSPEQGAEGYATQMLRLSRGKFDSGSMTKFIGALTEGTGATGNVSTLHFMRAMQGLGVDVGADQAESIMAAFRGGKLNDDVLAKAGLIEQKASARGGRKGMVAGAASLAGRGAGLAVAAAGLSAEQTGLGAGMAGTFHGLERATMGSVRALSEFNGALESIAKAQVTFMRIAVETLQSVGAGAKAKTIVDSFIGAIGLGGKPGHKK